MASPPTEFKLQKLSTRVGPIALVTMDNGEDWQKPNTFGEAALRSLEGVLDQLRSRDWRGLLLTGKPFVFGTATLGEGHPTTLLFGLPGNPVSSFVTFELFVRPAIRAMAGRRDLLRPVDRAVLGDDVSKSAGRRAYVRVISERDATGAPIRDEQGRVRVRLSGGAAGQGSHVISALAAADALAVIPEADDSLPAGAEVALWWLDRA